MSHKLQSKSFNKKKNRKKIGLVVLICVAFILVSGVVVTLSRLSVFTIHTVQIFGADTDISSQLKNTVEDSLKGYYLGLFPHASTLIYPKGNIIAQLAHSSQRIDSVQIKREGMHGLIVSVNQKVPVAIACAGLPDWEGSKFSISKNDTCFFTDKEGFAFQSFSSGIPVVYPLLYTLNASLGSYIASSTTFILLQSFITSTRAIGIPSQGILIKEGGEYELYASSTIIYFTEKAGIKKQLDNLLLFWNTMMNSDPKMKVKHFSDIKLQFPPNVYYTEVK